MNDLIKYDNIESHKETLMTISEVAAVFKVDQSTVRRYTYKMFPGKIINGVRTLYDEKEVTAIKLKMQQNQYLVSPADLPKTNLEKKLLVQQAIQILSEEIEELKADNELKTEKLKEAQPKIEFHDQVGDSEGLYNIGEVAKMLNLGYGRNIFFKNLREMKIFFKREPYQKYIDQGYFEVKTSTNNDHVQKQSFVTGKGMQWLQKKFNSNASLQLGF